MTQKIRRKDKIDRTVSSLCLMNDRSKKGNDIVDLHKEDLIVKIMDSTSRRSWVYLHVSVPKLQIEIEDWFHIFSTDGEYLKLDYGFNRVVRNNANDLQLVSLLDLLTKHVIDCYVYVHVPPANNAIGIVIDRFNELDNRPYFKKFTN
jgi:hypothetical protein